MLAEMSSQELAGWMAYYRVEPFGEDRADLRSAVAGSAIVNTLSKAHFKDPPEFPVSALMPFHEKTEPTNEERARKIAAKFGLRE